MAMEGKTALVESIVQDLEDKIQLALVLDDDPGQGSRSLAEGRASLLLFAGRDRAAGSRDTKSRGAMSQRILIACIGNMFLGDDGFGVEAARVLAAAGLGSDVKLVNYGIRGLDLAYALLDPWESVILIDAVARGGAPGTLYLLQPMNAGEPQTQLGSTRTRWIRCVCWR